MAYATSLPRVTPLLVRSAASHKGSLVSATPPQSSKAHRSHHAFLKRTGVPDSRHHWCRAGALEVVQSEKPSFLDADTPKLTGCIASPDTESQSEPERTEDDTNGEVLTRHLKASLAGVEKYSAKEAKGWESQIESTLSQLRVANVRALDKGAAPITDASNSTFRTIPISAGPHQPTGMTDQVVGPIVTGPYSKLELEDLQYGGLDLDLVEKLLEKQEVTPITMAV
eukprot:CAMPEP_0118953618 /NCGR_PEP_ID=MMETSP1169-20130426/56886_1 /TAXON_ID=36882 /ORGANISM="Pyramimonas obovata, Strain CCMP722" /LENGTH=225 /DNA_ID=CAMNT_0006901123 /DNA_START=83 /DNA_END=756 /DNA_ORIENTATION=+